MRYCDFMYYTATAHWEDYTTTYDHAGRVTAQTVSINNNSPLAISTSAYNSIGQLEQHTPGSYHTMFYSYNVRGQMQGIASSKFAQELYYTDSPTNPCYNGNVSQMRRLIEGLPTFDYNFTYDGADRLIRARSGNCSVSGADFSTEYSYNLNSAPLSIRRMGPTGGNAYGVIDDLTLTYNGGKLTRVDDAAAEVLDETSLDFTDGVQRDNEMAYDLNGRLIKDLNRGITQIVYNDASLPSDIYFNGNKRYSMTYDADGNLLSRKEIYLSRPGMSYPFAGTLAFGGIEPPTIEPTPFEPLLVSTETDYFGTQHWKGLSLDRIETTDGYIKNDTLSAYYRDFQGNICAVIRGGKLIQATNYYPYGMPIAGGTNPDEQRHKYSGKELLTHYGLNAYDFGPRLYDPALLQYHTPDPLREKYSNLNSYLYCAANPIRFTDPSGKFIIAASGKDAEILLADLQAMFGAERFDGFREHISRDKNGKGKRINAIPDEVKKKAMQNPNLSEDDKALISLFINVVNADYELKIDYIRSGESLPFDIFKEEHSSMAKVAEAMRQDVDVVFPDNESKSKFVLGKNGGALTRKSKKGASSFIDLNSPVLLYPRESTFGHESFGHGFLICSGIENADFHHVYVIQVENLIYRVMGIPIIRDGSDHHNGDIISNPSDLPKLP